MAAPSRSRRLARIALWCFAAVAVPLLAAFAQQVLARSMTSRSAALGWVGTGSLAGALLGMLLGVRSGRLSGWAFGPPMGFLAGVLDVRLFEFLYGRGYLPLSWASLLPTWSLALGVFAAWPRRSARAIVAVVLGAALAQTAAQGAWYLLAGRFNSSLQPWLGALTYSPPALLLLLFGTPPLGSESIQKPGTAQVLGNQAGPFATN